MITAEQATALIGAVAALVVAITALIAQVMHLNHQINSRMTELVDLTRASAHAQGVLDATPTLTPENKNLPS